MRALRSLFVALAIALPVVASVGCRDNGVAQPAWPALVPAQGVVTQGGAPAAGGVVKFEPIPPNDQFLVNGVVQANGAFELSTVRTTDTTGERKPGAPAGDYTVVFLPPAADQTAGYVAPPTLPGKVTIAPAGGELQLAFPAAAR